MKITHQLALLGLAISAITLAGCAENALSMKGDYSADTGSWNEQDGGAPEDPAWDSDGGGEDNGCGDHGGQGNGANG